MRPEAERINELKYYKPSRPTTREPLESNLFLTGPGEFLVSVFAEELRKIEPWSTLFGDNIADYERMDFSIRSLPGMRVYCERYQKEAETWYMTGDVICDVIWPASIRRGELSRLPQTIGGAMLQQLRSPTFFQAIDARVPGLTEFGRNLRADYDLGFKYEENLVPLTRLTANFSILLDEWDRYLESDYRTKDDPFRRTLGDLTTLYTVIEALRSDDPSSVELILSASQSLK